MRTSSLNILKNALLLAGAFFLLIASSSCKEKGNETSEWVTKDPPSTESNTEETQASSKPESEAAAEANPTTDEHVRFLSYNLKNYLTMRRGKEYLPKPEKEIDALIGVIARQKPDILGVSEIGKEADLLDLQKRLKNVGIDLPHYEHTGGRDQTRHLGFLSRYPIVATNSQSDLSYEMTGEDWVISRGILDATVDVNGTELRFLGVHLKSKREIEEADQELIRQNEARLLRDYADTILDDNLETHLIAYGDFNDTIGSKAISIARGRSNANKHMADFYFKDSRYELWTHFWDYQDTYARIDYVLFSRSVKPMLVGKESHIVDDEQWYKASDHRALMLVLKP
ncbi:MAG: endonuclease/exonuclease/phosphatase family protein [Roseibacillus sp.]